MIIFNRDLRKTHSISLKQWVDEYSKNPGWRIKSHLPLVALYEIQPNELHLNLGIFESIEAVEQIEKNPTKRYKKSIDSVRYFREIDERNAKTGESNISPLSETDEEEIELFTTLMNRRFETGEFLLKDKADLYYELEAKWHTFLKSDKSRTPSRELFNEFVDQYKLEQEKIPKWNSSKRLKHELTEIFSIREHGLWVWAKRVPLIWYGWQGILALVKAVF